MSTTPDPDNGDPTVSMPARPAPPTTETRRLLELLQSRPRRRPWLAAVVAIVLFAVLAAGSFYLVQRMKPLIGNSPRGQEAAAPPVMPKASQLAPPTPRVSDKPSSPRQMLKEIFDGRDQGHAVTASVERGAVRIGSSTPGYVYVVAASANQFDGAPLFVAMLFPRAADTNNRIQPGQRLTLPDLQWPANAEFLAIVSDERRDIDVLGQLVGKAVCSSTSPCSESYGAVVFSSEGIRATPPIPAAAKAPAARPTHAGSRRCSDILERASLGESLTDEEQTFLTRECR